MSWLTLYCAVSQEKPRQIKVKLECNTIKFEGIVIYAKNPI